MGRTPKPWWWKERKAYYATINGKRTSLGTNLKSARIKLSGLLKKEPQPIPINTSTMIGILDRFLDWVQHNRAPKTYRWYKDFFDSFSKMFPTLYVADLTAEHVTDWLDSQPTWNATTRRGAIWAISRAINWGIRNAGLASNPIRDMEKPTANRRTETNTIQEVRQILRNTKDRAFRRLLIFCWDVGCRPQEAKQLEPRHVDLEHRRCILPPDEAKGKKEPRVIYLVTDRAMRMVKAGMEQERLFLNTRNRPWTTSAVKCRFARLEEKVGKRYRMYSLRHSWITRKLVAGVDSHTVAKLAGHQDTKMLDRVYSHIADDYNFLLEQGRKEKAS